MDPAAEQADRVVRLAVDLVNLRARLPAGTPLDAGTLRRFLAEHGEPTPVRLGPADAEAIAAVEAELRAVFDAAGVDKAAALVNGLLQRAGSRPRLSNHHGTPWHLHVTDDDAPWAEWLAATTGLGLARLLAEDGMARLGRCAAPGCRRVFAGGPRNHPRRYCSPACGNAARVRAFRDRHRGRTGRPGPGGAVAAGGGGRRPGTEGAGAEPVSGPAPPAPTTGP